MAEVKKKSVEEMFTSLEGVINELESENVPLEKAFSLYEQGVKLTADLNKEIDLVEKKVLELTGEGEAHEFS